MADTMVSTQRHRPSQDGAAGPDAVAPSPSPAVVSLLARYLCSVHQPVCGAVHLFACQHSAAGASAPPFCAALVVPRPGPDPSPQAALHRALEGCDAAMCIEHLVVDAAAWAELQPLEAAPVHSAMRAVGMWIALAGGAAAPNAGRAIAAGPTPEPGSAEDEVARDGARYFQALPVLYSMATHVVPHFVAHDVRRLPAEAGVSGAVASVALFPLPTPADPSRRPRRSSSKRRSSSRRRSGKDHPPVPVAQLSAAEAAELGRHVVELFAAGRGAGLPPCPATEAMISMALRARFGMPDVEPPPAPAPPSEVDAAEPAVIAADRHEEEAAAAEQCGDHVCDYEAAQRARLRRRLERFYAEYQSPDRASELIPAALGKACFETKLFATLSTKYGPEPTGATRASPGDNGDTGSLAATAADSSKRASESEGQVLPAPHPALVASVTVPLAELDPRDLERVEKRVLAFFAAVAPGDTDGTAEFVSSLPSRPDTEKELFARLRQQYELPHTRALSVEQCTPLEPDRQVKDYEGSERDRLRHRLLQFYGEHNPNVGEDQVSIALNKPHTEAVLFEKLERLFALPPGYGGPRDAALAQSSRGVGRRPGPKEGFVQLQGRLVRVAALREEMAQCHSLEELAGVHVREYVGADKARLVRRLTAMYEEHAPDSIEKVPLATGKNMPEATLFGKLCALLRCEPEPPFDPAADVLAAYDAGHAAPAVQGQGRGRNGSVRSLQSSASDRPDAVSRLSGAERERVERRVELLYALYGGPEHHPRGIDAATGRVLVGPVTAQKVESALSKHVPEGLIMETLCQAYGVPVPPPYDIDRLAPGPAAELGPSWHGGLGERIVEMFRRNHPSAGDTPWRAVTEPQLMDALREAYELRPPTPVKDSPDAAPEEPQPSAFASAHTSGDVPAFSVDSPLFQHQSTPAPRTATPELVRIHGGAHAADPPPPVPVAVPVPSAAAYTQTSAMASGKGTPAVLPAAAPAHPAPPLITGPEDSQATPERASPTPPPALPRTDTTPAVAAQPLGEEHRRNPAAAFRPTQTAPPALSMPLVARSLDPPSKPAAEDYARAPLSSASQPLAGGPGGPGAAFGRGPVLDATTPEPKATALPPRKSAAASPLTPSGGDPLSGGGRAVSMWATPAAAPPAPSPLFAHRSPLPSEGSWGGPRAAMSPSEHLRSTAPSVLQEPRRSVGARSSGVGSFSVLSPISPAQQHHQGQLAAAARTPHVRRSMTAASLTAAAGASPGLRDATGSVRGVASFSQTWDASYL